MRRSTLLLTLLLLSCGAPSEQSSTVLTTGTAISTDGVPIVYDVQGRGEPSLVFVHGWAGYRGEWAPQMAHFSSSHRVVAIDLAGHGDSGDDRQSWTMQAFGNDVASVIRALGINSAILIGHSMGTPVILEAALIMPDEVTGLVPVDMLKNVERGYSPERIEEWVKAYMAGMENPTRESLAQWFTTRMDSTVVDNYVHYCQRTAQRHWLGWEGSLREVLTWAGDRQTDVLRGVHVPVICINADPPRTNLDMARKYLESVDVRTIEGAGHSIHWEVPQEFNQVLEEVLLTLQESDR